MKNPAFICFTDLCLSVGFLLGFGHSDLATGPLCVFWFFVPCGGFGSCKKLSPGFSFQEDIITLKSGLSRLLAQPPSVIPPPVLSDDSFAATMFLEVFVLLRQKTKTGLLDWTPPDLPRPSLDHSASIFFAVLWAALPHRGPLRRF